MKYLLYSHMQKFDVNKLRVASPCSVGWDTMTGDERVRHCHACQLNIYNTAEMTTTEVQSLVENREGRLCIRMFRRMDGTVLTKDCPVGLRMYQKKIARFATAAFSSILGLFSISNGQDTTATPLNVPNVKIERTETTSKESMITGTIRDAVGAVVPNVTVKISGKKLKKSLSVKTNSEGGFAFDPLSAGVYTLVAEAASFKKKSVKYLSVSEHQRIDLTIQIENWSGYITVGMVDDDSYMIDLSSASITQTVYRRKNN